MKSIICLFRQHDWRFYTTVGKMHGCLVRVTWLKCVRCGKMEPL